MGKFLNLLKFATKAGIAGGAVYVTVDQGVWGKDERTSALYEKIYEIVPGARDFPKEYIKDYVPNTDGYQSAAFYWNKGVFGTFNFIANIPNKIVSGKDYLVSLVSIITTDEETPKATESA